MLSKDRIIIVVVLVLVIALALFITLTPESERVGEYSLAPEQQLTLAEARVASTSYALDGSGDFTEDTCKELGYIANQFNEDIDFIGCTSTMLFLDTPDTSDTNVLTLSNDNYTSKFTMSKDNTTLINYEFLDAMSGGFNEFGGRKS